MANWWNFGFNGSPSGVPRSGDDVSVVRAGGLPLMLSYANAEGAAQTLNSLKLSAEGAHPLKPRWLLRQPHGLLRQPHGLRHQLHGPPTKRGCAANSRASCHPANLIFLRTLD